MPDTVRKQKKLMEDLLEIHMLMSEMSSFIPIQMCIRSLDENAPAYKEIVKYSSKIVDVLTTFSKTKFVSKEEKKDD